jgi:hypothetical protein
MIQRLAIRWPRANGETVAKRRESKKSTKRHYDPSAILDAPEYYDYARAMGVLTWGTWDHEVRPADQRIADFVSTYPPEEPTRFMPSGSLLPRNDAHRFGPGTPEVRLQRFLADDWRPGSIHELLSRHGLKLAGAPARQLRPFEPGSLRDTTRRRNVRLRLLHGGVDIEPENMDAAKAEYLDRQEAKQAALDVRDALKRMRQELNDDDGPPGPSSGNDS